MNLKLFRNFIAIVEAGSLSRAASLVRIAQPALSNQLAQLENDLGARLVTRTARGVEPTMAGKRLYRHAQAILRQLEEAKIDVLHSAEDISGSVSIGLLTSTAMLLTLPLLQAVHNIYPEIKLQIFESFSGYLYELLLNNRFDLAILLYTGPMKGVDCTPLLTESLYLLSRSSTSEEASFSTIDMRTMMDRPLVLPSKSHSQMRALIDRGFSEIRINPKIIAEVDSLSTMREVALQGIADAILPYCALTPLRQASASYLVRRLTHPGISRSLALCRARSMPITAAVSAVAELLVEQIQNSLPTGAWGEASLFRNI